MNDEYLVSVTEHHIENGKQSDNLLCPIARAIEDAGIEDMVACEVFSFSINIHMRNHGFIVLKISTSLQRWIREFDEDRHNARPMKVRLDFQRKWAARIALDATL